MSSGSSRSEMPKMIEPCRHRRRFLHAYICALACANRAWSWSTNQKASPLKHDEETSTERRRMLNAVGAVMTTTMPSICNAGEIGARITQAVTTSELGLSVRRSVVRGAQVMDSLDLQAERFSDRLGLGSERAARPGKPKPKIIPELKTLDKEFVALVLDASDETFCDVARVRRNELQSRIRTVADAVRPSFERSGLTLSTSGAVENGSQFNYACYVKYKAYCDLIADKNINFKKLKRDFEDQVGQRVATLLVPGWTGGQKVMSSTPEERKRLLSETVKRIEVLTSGLVDKGVVASVDLAPLDADDIDDWSKDLSSLSWSIALDGDSTLQAQILLQEQGLRFYPNFARFAIEALLRQLDGQEVTTEDYYMDTDYNSDPDKFEVKEVLVNINIESIL